MQLTYKFNCYKHFDRLNNLCKISKNLYNQANYLVKQELENNKKWLRYNDLDKLLKETKNLEGGINYRLLKTQMSQQVLRLLDKDWKSYFNASKEYKKNPGKFKGLPKPPAFKREVNQLIFTNQTAVVNGNMLCLYKDLKIKIPEYVNKDFKYFNLVRINPKRGFVEVEIVYTIEENHHVENDNVIGIDLGVTNFATLVSNVLPQPVIFSGGPLKSLNQNFNRKLSKLQSVRDKMKLKKTKQISKLNEKRTRRMDDLEHKINRKIVDIAKSKNVSTIVVGKNKQWKDSIALGNKNNQTFVQIPHARFIDKLTYKCKMNGIKLHVTEESYTSKVDHLAFEEMREHEVFKGTRIKRGLFQSSSGTLINADVNGALGILRKFVENKNVLDNSPIREIINRGNLLTPFKIRNIFDVQTLNKVIC